MRLTRFEWGCLAVVAVSFALRATFLLAPQFIWDTAWYLMNSRAFLETGTFLIRWSDPAAPLYSGYWPPLFPIFAAPFVKIVGPSFQAMVAAAIAASALLVAAVFGMTRDLYGRKPAFAAMALTAASPAFYLSDERGMSESLLALAVALTVWAFLKSLDRPRWLPVAGVFAILAYLGKASLGLPFVAAGVVALAAWRVWSRGWRRVVRSPMDMGIAAAAALGFSLLAATRSERIGGLGLGLIEPLHKGFFLADCSRYLPFESVGPHCWLMLYPAKIVFVLAFLFVVALPASLALRRAIRAPRSERTDALWLATLLPVVAGAVFTTTFFFTERRNFVDFDNIRYLTPSIVPFLWLVIPHGVFAEDAAASSGERFRRRHVVLYWTAVGVMVALLFLNPVRGAPTAAGFSRFVAFMMMALVPIAIALVARRTHYEVVERQTHGTIERRYVAAKPPPGDRRLGAALALLLVATGWYFSAWYAFVGVGVVVAFSTTSSVRRVVAMAFVLLGSAASSAHSELPVRDANELLASLPEGTVVGMGEIVVYPAATAPANVQVRLVYPEQGIPEGIEILLLQSGAAEREYDNFTRLHSWDYQLVFSPVMRARVWIEERILGQVFEYERLNGLTVYARNGTGLERYDPSPAP